MDHYIVQDGGRRKHKAPVKRESAFGAAASPTGLLVPDGDAVIGTSGELAVVGGSFGEIVFGCGDIAFF